jgi:hypothetical protein
MVCSWEYTSFPRNLGIAIAHERIAGRAHKLPRLLLARRRDEVMPLQVAIIQ